MEIDLREKGRGPGGQVISLDRRLFMQFVAFGDCVDEGAVIDALETAGIEGAVYADMNDANGIGLVTMSESADFFMTDLRSLLKKPPFSDLTPKPEYTMLGRTYSIGYESDLVETLIDRPRRRVLDANWPWVIWYPLQRAKTFETLPDTEKKRMLGEHGNIGKAFGKADYAIDIRLACHGLDKNDNDFVIGLLGHELHPISGVVQQMRHTKQTSEYLTSLGPFFVGKVIWQAAG